MDPSVVATAIDAVFVELRHVHGEALRAAATPALRARHEALVIAVLSLNTLLAHDGTLVAVAEQNNARIDAVLALAAARGLGS